MTITGEDIIESNADFETKPEKQQKLFERQNELGDLIGVNPELLRGIGLCQSCDGRGQLLETSVGRMALNAENLSAPVDDTQIKKCEECGGLGLEFGDLDLTPLEWISLSRNNLYGVNINTGDGNGYRHKPERTVTKDVPKISEEERILLEQIRAINANGRIAGKPRQRGRFHAPDVKNYRTIK